jgi:hypothetical protein
MIAIAAVVAPMLAVTAWSGPMVSASTSTTAVAQAVSARADAARSPDPVAVREAAVRAEIMRLRALGQLRGPVSPEMLARLAAQGTTTGAAPAGLTPITNAVTSGAIMGVVRDARGLPLRGVCVTATSRASYASHVGAAGHASQASTAGEAGTAGQAGRAGWANTAFAVTGADGRYVLAGLRPGSYTLAYRGCAAPGRYVSQWSGGAAWPGLAAPVSVTADQVRVAPPATLRPVNPAALLPSQPRPGWVISTGHAASAASTAHGSRISGLVTGKGKPLKGVCVIVWRLFHNGATGVGVTTSRTGRYSVGGLRRGHYQVEFADTIISNCSTNWLNQWYKGLKGLKPFRPSSATTIVLKTGQRVRASTRSSSWAADLRRRDRQVRQKARRDLRQRANRARATRSSAPYSRLRPNGALRHARRLPAATWSGSAQLWLGQPCCSGGVTRPRRTARGGAHHPPADHEASTAKLSQAG